MPVFQLNPIERFHGSSAAIKRPKEIACFSYDEQHQYFPDARSLRYYFPPRLGADLSKGFETFEQLDDSKDGHIDSLLKTIMLLEKETGERCDVNFVTWRGMMSKIMATPGDNLFGSSFEMNATVFQGIIFIEENHEYKLRQRTEQQQQPSRGGDPSQDLMSFWGYKFETLSLIPDIWDVTSREYIESREDHVVNNHAQYCSIARTGIGKSRLILGGEVDAVWDEKSLDPDVPTRWVELKTSACIENDFGRLKFERKLKKFWIQSFLLGIPKIIVGFRDRRGFLRSLEELETSKIPATVKKGSASWDGNTCINFAAAFLEWLQEIIAGEEGVWRILRKEQSQIVEVLKVHDYGHGEILTQEFLAWRQQKPDESTSHNAQNADS